MSRDTGSPSDNLTSALLEQVAQGNEEAFEELCRIYRGPLFRVALNILGNAETAEEVVQDSLLAVWKGSKNFNGGSRPFSWMWSIVRNKAIDALRNSTRPEEFKAQHDNDGTAKDPEQDAVICQALEKLSPEHRLAIILTYYLNLSQTQISQIMQCPLGTVKSRLSNALKQVREFWQSRDIQATVPEF